MPDGGNASEVGSTGYDGPPSSPLAGEGMVALRWRAERREAGGRPVLQIYREDDIIGMISLSSLPPEEIEWIIKRLSIIYHQKLLPKSINDNPHQET